MQCFDGNQRFGDRVADAFGGAHTDAKAGVGARSHADGDGVELIIRNTSCFHHFIDEKSDFFAVILAFRVFLASQNLAIMHQSHRTRRCSSFQTENHDFVFFGKNTK